MPHGRRRKWPKPVNERRRAGSPEPRQSTREPRYEAITRRTAFFYRLSSRKTQRWPLMFISRHKRESASGELGFGRRVSSLLTSRRDGAVGMGRYRLIA